MTEQSKRPADLRWWAHRLVFVALLAITVVAFFRRPKEAHIVVPVHDLPAYHVIVAGDLAIKSVKPDEVKPGSLVAPDTAEGHYLLEPLKADQPVMVAELGPVPDPRLIQNTLVVELPVGKYAVTGPIQSGDVVSVTAIQTPPAPTSMPSDTLVLSEALVLNVNPATATLTLAVPITEWPKFYAKTIGADVTLARLLK